MNAGKPIAMMTLIMTLLVCGMTSPAIAAGTVVEGPPASLVDKAFQGVLTDSEKSLLVRDWPGLAAVLPDVNTAETVVTEAPSIQQRAAVRCQTYSGWNTMKSLLGFTLYRFEHKANVCSNGSKVTSHSQPFYTISQADATVDNWSVVDKSVRGVGSYTSASRIQIRVQQCVAKYGCYASHYPMGTITAYGNHTAKINTTAR